MTDSIPHDQEPPDTQAETSLVLTKPRRSISKIRRELDESELQNNQAALRLLLDEIDRSDRQIIELEGFEERFHVVDKSNAVNEQKLKEYQSSNIMYDVCLAVGAALLGFAPNLWDHHLAAFLSIIFGFILIVGAIISRRKQR
jgi:ribosomal protein S8